jgi:hypothetical protein
MQQMKKKIIILIFLGILLAFHNQINNIIIDLFHRSFLETILNYIHYKPSSKYTMMVNDINLDRSCNIRLDAKKLGSCISDYKWKNYKLSYVNNLNRISDSIFDVNIIVDDNIDIQYLSARIEVYPNCKEADQSYQERFTKKECREYLAGIEDVAFLSTIRCWKSGSLILYANTIIGLDIDTPSERGHSFGSDSKDIDIFNRQHQIYLIFINDFYPFFRKCAEKAKVPVNPESSAK